MVCKELKFDLIVRALGSAEEMATGTAPLDKLCKAIAKCSGATYAPDRLRKTSSVRALTTLGGRVMRQKELDGVYEFDGNGLPKSQKILLVDDLVTTGATLEAATEAIKKADAGADVLHFVLARVEAQAQNSHLDAKYFLGSSAQDPRQKSGPLAIHPPAPGAQSRTAAETRNARKDSSAFRASYIASEPRKGGLDTKVYVIGLLASLVLLGTTVLIPMKKEEAATTKQFAQLVSQNEVKSPDPIPERRATVVEQFPGPDARAGVILVPSTGLRTRHSMESQAISGTSVRHRERVEIIKRYSSRTGPDWIQIRTQKGATGWVIASVVKEVKS
jgi:hypothetical protein